MLLSSTKRLIFGFQRGHGPDTWVTEQPEDMGDRARAGGSDHVVEGDRSRERARAVREALRGDRRGECPVSRVRDQPQDRLQVGRPLLRTGRRLGRPLTPIEQEVPLVAWGATLDRAGAPGLEAARAVFRQRRSPSLPLQALFPARYANISSDAHPGTIGVEWLLLGPGLERR